MFLECWTGWICEVNIGAIVSQAQGNMEFLPLFFEKVEEKWNLEDILTHFKSIDDNIESRQIGMVTLKGESLSFTGSKCFRGNQKSGEGYACQGNILTSPSVIEAMAEAFEKTDGSLTRRLYTSLQAGDEAGGELRGKMSARVWIEKKRDNPLTDTLIDFVVEDHREPVREIGRLMNLRDDIYKAWGLMSKVSSSSESKVALLEELETFLEDKEDRAFLDFFEFLGDEYLKLGKREKGISVYRKYKSISPKIAEYLNEDIKKQL
jgi:uncharacterized Ntn-hydrolase superfamily protein